MKRFLLAALIAAGFGIPAFAEVSASTDASDADRALTGSLQKGLRELQPGLFKANQLPRETGCLAAALYFEARGESRLGQIAVAQVIINRVRSRHYPDSICGVVWQNAHMRNRCQFSFTCDGRIDWVQEKRAWARAVAIAGGCLSKIGSGSVPHAVNPVDRLDENTQRSTHYHANRITPSWSKKLVRMRTIGRHIFYVSERVERTIARDS